MSRFKQLGPGWADVLNGEGLEDEMGVDFLVALGCEARLREAARSLALEEHLLGTHVDESDLANEQIRLAAQDRAQPEVVVFADGGLRVRARVAEGGLDFVQVGGAPGATVVLGETWVPLQPELVARAEGFKQMPSQLVVLDRRGRRRMLRPER